MTNGGHRSGRSASGDGQTELFPAETDPGSPRTPEAAGGRAEKSPSPLSSRDLAGSQPPGREEALEALLSHCAPVKAGSREAAWLKERRIFRKTWLAQGLRVVSDYRSAANGLAARFTRDALVAWGLFNREGHLRFYRHSLLVPWVDGARVAHLQAFATDAAAKPAALSVAGAPACPYNARLLDGSPGRLYLCAGVVRALELIEAGFPAAGAGDDGVLRTEWLPRFRGKSVYVAYGGGAEMEAAAVKTIAALTERGVEAHRLIPSSGSPGEGRTLHVVAPPGGAERS